MARGRPDLRAGQDAHRRVPPRRPHVDLPRRGRGERGSTRRRGRVTSSSPTSRPTTRSATAPPATASATRSRRGSRRSGPPSTCSRRSRRWSSWARSGARARRSPSSPRSRRSGSRTRCAPGRRGEFAAHGWDEADVPDPQDPATRAQSVLDWSEPSAPGHNEMLHFYRELIKVRRTQPDVASGDLRATSVTVRRGRSGGSSCRVAPSTSSPTWPVAPGRAVRGRGRARPRVLGARADRRRARRLARRPRRRRPAHRLTPASRRRQDRGRERGGVVDLRG